MLFQSDDRFPCVVSLCYKEGIIFCSLLLVWVWLRVTELSHHALRMETGCAFGICAQNVIDRDLVFPKNLP